MSENLKQVFIFENRAVLSAEQIIEKGYRLKAYCEKNRYLPGGSLSISEPMSRSGSELRWITDYCRNRGIDKILVDSIRDIGTTPLEVQKVNEYLCGRGICMEVAYNELTLAVKKESTTESFEDQCLMMGGM